MTVGASTALVSGQPEIRLDELNTLLEELLNGIDLFSTDGLGPIRSNLDAIQYILIGIQTKRDISPEDRRNLLVNILNISTTISSLTSSTGRLSVDESGDKWTAIAVGAGVGKPLPESPSLGTTPNPNEVLNFLARLTVYLFRGNPRLESNQTKKLDDLFDKLKSSEARKKAVADFRAGAAGESKRTEAHEESPERSKGGDVCKESFGEPKPTGVGEESSEKSKYDKVKKYISIQELQDLLKVIDASEVFSDTPKVAATTIHAHTPIISELTLIQRPDLPPKAKDLAPTPSFVQRWFGLKLKTPAKASAVELPGTETSRVERSPAPEPSELSSELPMPDLSGNSHPEAAEFLGLRH